MQAWLCVRLALTFETRFAQTTDLLIARLRRSASRCAAKGRLFLIAFRWDFLLMITSARVLPGFDPASHPAKYTQTAWDCVSSTQ